MDDDLGSLFGSNPDDKLPDGEPPKDEVAATDVESSEDDGVAPPEKELMIPMAARRVAVDADQSYETPNSWMTSVLSDQEPKQRMKWMINE